MSKASEANPPMMLQRSARERKIWKGAEMRKGTVVGGWCP